MYLVIFLYEIFLKMILKIFFFFILNFGLILNGGSNFDYVGERNKIFLELEKLYYMLSFNLKLKF